jgi:DNA mismatch endonuclease, patch repair protein
MLSASRQHRGDTMSAEKRSALMSRIKGKDTGPERVMAGLFRRARRRFETHARDLPSRPDFVFRRAKVAVFVDGDFWHGWRFPAWKLKLSEKWESKIAANRRRDARVHAKLRRSGWTVIRIWEHQIQRDPDACLQRVLAATRKPPGGHTRTPLSSSSIDLVYAGA